MQLLKISICLCIILILQACNKKNRDINQKVQFETLGLSPEFDSAKWHWKWRDITPSMVSQPGSRVKIITGNRFRIIGDFDGDLIEDELKECFLDEHDKETYKFINIRNYEEQVAQIHARNTQSFLLPDKTKIDTLFGNMQSFGFLWVENLGNIDAKKGDELLIVHDLADWSAINSASIYSIKNGEWKQLCSWTVHESWFTQNRATYFKNEVVEFNPALEVEQNPAQIAPIVSLINPQQIQIKYFEHDVRDSLITLR